LYQKKESRITTRTKRFIDMTEILH